MQLQLLKMKVAEEPPDINLMEVWMEKT
jgi:hypothetical protein